MSHFGSRIASIRSSIVSTINLVAPAKIKKILLSTPLITNPTRVKSVLTKLVFIRVLLLSAMLGITAWTLLIANNSTENFSDVFWPIGITYAISILNIIGLRYVKRLLLFGYCQLLIDVLLATFVIYLTGSSVSIVLYLLVIIGAALVFGRHGAVIIAAVAGICYAFLASGLFTSAYGHALTGDPHDILLVYLSLVTIALASGYLTKELETLSSLADRRAKDITDLTEQQKRLFDGISEGIITVDLNSAITNVNQAAKAIMGLNTLDINQFTGKPLQALLDRCGISDSKNIFAVSDNLPHELIMNNDTSGESSRLNYSVRPITNNSGEHTGKLILFSDVSHLRSMEERLSLHERMAKLLADQENSISELSQPTDNSQIIGSSPIMKNIFALIDRVALSDASVLINGESGTGKELVARAIHDRGPRGKKPFIAINCGAIPENLIESELFGHKKGSFTGAISDNPGLFRQAQGGTIFLDEVGELPHHLQAKLLRVLQEKQVRPVGDVHDYPVDVRVVAATNRDLKDEVAKNTFREDLYYRLNVVNILVPPLRDRKEDIPLLVRYFVGKHCDPDQVLPQISPEALQLLMRYAFPGNIRELENIIERALVLGGKAILPDHLPQELFTKASQADHLPHKALTSADLETEIILLPIDLEKELSRIERNYLHRALDQASGIKKHAAELLGLNFRSFRYRLKKYNMGGESGMGDQE